MLRALAPAKVNLTLELLGRREDGYHEIRSVMVAISLCDEINVEPAPETSLTCSVPSLANERNLVCRAVELVRREIGRSDGLRIHLEKRIPEAAGLGGGSSDGAMALELAQQAWGVRLPETRARELAAQLGSDVPFFLGAGAEVVSGRGELSDPLPVPPLYLVLVHPPLALSTAAVYRAVLPEDYTDGARTRELARHIAQGERVQPAWLFNGMEPAAYRRGAELARYRDMMLDAGAGLVRVSGSGPTLFTVCDDHASAEALAQELARHGLAARVVQPMSRSAGHAVWRVAAGATAEE